MPAVGNVFNLKIRNGLIRMLFNKRNITIDKTKHRFIYNALSMGSKLGANPTTKWAAQMGVGGMIGGGIFASRVYSNFTNQIRAPQSAMLGRSAWGPGYPTWFKTRGMPPDHLGATGDLTIALGKLKHQSII